MMQKQIEPTVDMQVLEAMTSITQKASPRNMLRWSLKQFTHLTKGLIVAPTPSAVAVPASQRYEMLKRVMDIVIASAMLLLALPVMIVCAIAVKLDSGGPIIFSQERVGLAQGRKGKWETRGFMVYKFRTMHTNNSSESHQAFIKAMMEKDEETMAKLNGGVLDAKNKFKMTRDPRITRVGAFLRKTSLDELPQLFNVLNGTMSLVGPRPALPYEVNMYKPEYMGRLAAKPGITGWWQVFGRSQVGFDEIMAMDLHYVRSRSLLLDLKLIVLTPIAILQGKGAA
jgi:lipopolysaccharide/colanic/teichoic acid biosynthesis glycosyltransferase